MLRQIAAATLVACCLASAPATAQPAAPPHLSIVDGIVVVEHQNGNEPGVSGLPLVAGDRVRTNRGRAEIVFGNGSALHLDDGTLVVISGGSDVELASGRVVMHGSPDPADVLQLDAAPGSVRIAGGSDARVGLRDDSDAPTVVVGVVQGEADVATDQAGATVAAGQQVELRQGEAPGAPNWFNTADREGFYEWSTALLEGERDTTSAEYLPADLALEADAFDQSGGWSYLPPYGYVWCPRVEPGWQPYTRGRWTYVGGGVGWSFVGRERWAWATHHYGRWGVNGAGSWYWIPGNAWSAAWVRWGIAPGYVGWSPLGWDNQPIPRQGPPTRAGNESGRGWTTMASDDFRRGKPMASIPAAATRAPASVTFAFQQAPPTGPTAAGRLIVAGPGATAPGQARASAGSVPPTAGAGRPGDDRADASRRADEGRGPGSRGDREHRPPSNPYPPAAGNGGAEPVDAAHAGDSPAYAPHYNNPWAYAPRYQSPGTARPWPVRPPGAVPPSPPATGKPSTSPTPPPSPPPPPPPHAAQTPAHQSAPHPAAVPSPKGGSPKD